MKNKIQLVLSSAKIITLMGLLNLLEVTVKCLNVLDFRFVLV